MSVHRPPAVFDLTVTGSVHVEGNRRDPLFRPEWGRELKVALGMETERDLEDHESFAKRKARAARKRPLASWRDGFNNRMFGTPLPTHDSDEDEEDEEEESHSNLLREEGVFVAHGPEGVDSLIDQGRLYSRFKRESEQVREEEEGRRRYQVS